MKSRRREFSTNSLSFLDIMSCGLGAAVLLFLILKHDQVDIETDVVEASAESMLLEREVTEGQRYLADLLNSLETTEDEIATSRAEIARIEAELNALEAERSALDNPNQRVLELETRIEELRDQIAQIEAQQASGSKARTFLGQGQRQYLTGLNLGGRNILILVDRSASMLDETIVNVIRRRSRAEETRVEAPKWQRTVRIVDWLTANLPVDASVQILAFDTAVEPLLGNAINSWTAVSDYEAVDSAIANLASTPPAGGTSLFHAFDALQSMSPLPDNVFLITDGLPTQGESPPRGNTITGRDRVQLFNDAIRELPNRIPVNIILLPMEGDPLAASAYWRLAIQSRGSFLTPARDWP